MGVLAADLHGHTHARAHTGNPCVDPYICQDWENRFAVATANATNVGGVWVQKMKRAEPGKEREGMQRPAYDRVSDKKLPGIG